MLDRRSGTSEGGEVTKGDTAADSLSLPVELGQRIGQFPHHDGSAPRRCGYFPPCVGSKEIDESCDRWHVAVVDQETSTDSEPRCEMPPVEDRVRKSVRAVDQCEVEWTMWQRGEHLMGGADAKGDPCRRDLSPFAFLPDPLPLSLVWSDHLVIRPGSREDDRAVPGSGLERVEVGLELPFEPVERLPLEPPALIPFGVKPGWRPAKVSRYPLDASRLTAPEHTYPTDSSERLVSR